MLFYICILYLYILYYIEMIHVSCQLMVSRLHKEAAMLSDFAHKLIVGLVPKEHPSVPFLVGTDCSPHQEMECGECLPSPGIWDCWRNGLGLPSWDCPDIQKPWVATCESRTLCWRRGSGGQAPRAETRCEQGSNAEEPQGGHQHQPQAPTILGKCTRDAKSCPGEEPRDTVRLLF